MRVVYWICDGCKEIIDYDMKTKFSTPEIGYPYIPKDGGGKHFHRSCLIKYYDEMTPKLSKQEIAELIADAERRHENTLIKYKIKQGTLTKGKVDKRKAGKKAKDALINYFYDFYGLTNIPKGVNAYIDRLNDGDDFGDVVGVQIPYDQLKEMLIYYRKKLNDIHKNRIKKGIQVLPVERLLYDITIMINSISDYLNRPELLYNKTIHNQIDGGEKVYDNSQYIKRSKKKKEETKENQQLIEDIDEFLDSLDEELNGEEEE